MRTSKLLKWIEKVRDLLNILVANSSFFERKNLSKSAFQNELFADVFDPAGYSGPSGPWTTFALCRVGLYRTRRAKRPRREDGNAGNDKGGNEQYY